MNISKCNNQVDDLKNLGVKLYFGALNFEFDHKLRKLAVDSVNPKLQFGTIFIQFRHKLNELDKRKGKHRLVKQFTRISQMEHFLSNRVLPYGDTSILIYTYFIKGISYQVLEFGLVCHKIIALRAFNFQNI
ncbi:hypothetical protein BpHYR1_017357 [Brachionus plicatilis]|uniref:Uncharacterized protein n=1 Tax=Brachionus plicatilis TaxID=10195 RepID=A0A3M7QUE7_BRAPC|nr:hypothetical protein BpHYR1_017357 [Brachionus plicatilis]